MRRIRVGLAFCGFFALTRFVEVLLEVLLALLEDEFGRLRDWAMSEVGSNARTIQTERMTRVRTVTSV